MCGEVKSKEKEKTSSTPLVTVSDLQRMKLFEVIDIRLRMMPFKTKFTPEWKLNELGAWGKKYEKIDYPTREKKEVQLFDIREFVKEKKKEKMESMMSDGMSTNPFGGGSPFGGSPFGGMSPFGGTNPFSGGGSPFGGTNPFVPNETNTLNSLLGNNPETEKNNEESFNVDDLVKKIDAKIAELEEEERKEKEANLENNNIQKVVDAELDNEKEDTLYEKGTDSDDFFNDFFADDLDK